MKKAGKLCPPAIQRLVSVHQPKDSPQNRGQLRAQVTAVIPPDAETMLALLPEWIDDYCEVHPHSGLKYRSPREFLRLSA